MNTTKCPTCNAPAKMTWSGLDLVAESGDETLASKHYEFEPTALNTVLAPSGQPDIYSGALNEERIAKYRKLAKDYYIQEGTVRDIFCAGADWALSLAACAKTKGG